MKHSAIYAGLILFLVFVCCIGAQQSDFPRLKTLGMDNKSLGKSPENKNSRNTSGSTRGKGKILFCSDRDGNSEIYVANRDGSGFKRLTENSHQAFYPAWSPDGKHIAFQRGRNDNLDICMMNEDGSQKRFITKQGALDEYPSWGPDSRHIVFAANKENGKPASELSEVSEPEHLEIPFRADRLSERVLFIKSGSSAIMSNATAIATSRGLVVIDAQYKPEGGQRIRRVVEKAFERNDFIYLIYTHAGVDHMGGASIFPEVLIVGHHNCMSRINGLRERLKSVDIREVLNPRLELLRAKINAGPADEAEALKLDEALYYWSELCEMLDSGFEYARPAVTFDEDLTFHLGDVTINCRYCTPGYSESDILIHIPEEKLLVVGDIFNNDRIPLLHEKSDVKRWLDVFEPFVKGEEEVRHIIGGHDEIISLNELKAQYEYLEDLWEGVASAKMKGSSLEKAKEDFAFESRYPHLSHLKIRWISTPDNLHERNIEHIWKIVEQRIKREGFPVLKGPYLGQNPPGMKPEVFAPGIISTEESEELCSGFLDNGRVFIFSRLKPGEDWKKKPTYWMVLKEGVWTEPAEVPFNDLHPYNFSVAADGNTLYFSTCWSEKKPRNILEKDNIWRVKYADGIWGEPEKLGPEINADSIDPNYPTVAQNRTLYYMLDDPEGCGKVDLVYHKWTGNTYGRMMNVGAPVNTDSNELDPFIAPDESYIIFLGNYKDSGGNWDLYISYKDLDGNWTEPINMGDDINTSGWESRPYVTRDGKYFFFSRGDEDPSWADIYWVDAKIIEKLRPEGIE